MHGTPISLVRTVPLRCEAITPIVRTVLARLVEASQRGEVALDVDLRGTGRVSVPVLIREAAVNGGPMRFDVSVAALRAPKLFPRFEGRIDAMPADLAGTTNTAVSLTGRYFVPLGVVGRVADATITRGIAASGLSSFLERVIADVLADVAHSADERYLANRRQL